MRNNIHMEYMVTPLCPAGHLPHKGGERDVVAVPLSWQSASRHSPPLWGRCHGVTEGGKTRATEAGSTP